jgi:hypothetical protein
VVIAMVVATLALILFATIRSIRDELRAHRSIWRGFSPDSPCSSCSPRRGCAALRRIEEKLGTLPATAPTAHGEQ